MARTPGEAQLVEQEQWLRSNGLPLVVPPTRRLRGLVPRTVPLLVTLALLATGLVMVDAGVSAEDMSTSSTSCGVPRPSPPSSPPASSSFSPSPSASPTRPFSEG